MVKIQNKIWADKVEEKGKLFFNKQRVSWLQDCVTRLCAYLYKKKLSLNLSCNMQYLKFFRHYLSLTLLFIPAVLFGFFIFLFRENERLEITNKFPFLPWQFLVISAFGLIATIGGILDWNFHRDPLNMKIPKKERDAEAKALGLGGLPMFILMWFAMISTKPSNFLIPILIVLIYTVTAICYDEFVFHIKRCGRVENNYHRMLVFGNGIAWLSWFHFIYCK